MNKSDVRIDILYSEKARKIQKNDKEDLEYE